MIPLFALLAALGGGAAGGIGGAFAKKNQRGISSFFTGEKGEEQQAKKYTPEQEEVLNQLLQQGMGEAGGTGIEDLARKRFSEDAIPSLAERFTSMGGEGGQRSSGFESSIGRARADLEAQLAALGQQGGMQKLQLGLGQRFDTGMGAPTQGILGAKSLAALLPALAKMFG